MSLYKKLKMSREKYETLVSVALCYAEKTVDNSETYALNSAVNRIEITIHDSEREALAHAIADRIAITTNPDEMVFLREFISDLDLDKFISDYEIQIY